MFFKLKPLSSTFINIFNSMNVSSLSVAKKLKFPRKMGGCSHIFKIAVMGSLLQALMFSGAHAEEGGGLTSEIQKASYGVGVKYGEGLKRDLEDLDLNAFVQGLQQAFKGQPLSLNEEEITQAVTAYQQRKVAERRSLHMEEAKKNLMAGKAFLEENSKKDGVKVTDSGLQYMVMKQGAGETPSDTDRVKVHYHGTLIDGTVFDSSIDRGEPIVFPVNGVIAGWTEALKMMKVGDQWKLFIPADLAYGEHGTRGTIGPNAALIFEVELLEIPAEG